MDQELTLKDVTPKPLPPHLQAISSRYILKAPAVSKRPAPPKSSVAPLGIILNPSRIPPRQVTQKVRWSQYELDFIRKYASVLTDEEGAERLSAICGRRITKGAWRRKRQAMGVAKICGRGKCGLAADQNAELNNPSKELALVIYGQE